MNLASVQKGLCAVLLMGVLAGVACKEREAPAPTGQAQRSEEPAVPAAPSEAPAPPKPEPSPGTLTLPTNFGKRTGDLDEMVNERTIRALVVINPIGFFYLGGRPQGVHYEALQEFERFANKKLKTGKLPVKIVYLPMRPDQLEPALRDGLGDFISMAVAVTPERERRVAFSTPIQRDVSRVVVTSSQIGTATSFDDLAGQAIYVNPLTVYDDDLKRLNDKRMREGKAPLDVRAADRNLFDDDLIQMVNAGLIPATVTNQWRADLWAQVLPNIRSQAVLAVAREGETAWVMRKENPKLKKLVDEFLQDHAAGTTFGNTLLRRYLQDTKWIRNATAEGEMQKFIAYAQFFKKYGTKYDFDYLMLAAQGYQESLLDQNKVSPAGAVGVMQVIPKFAAADPINIPNVRAVDGNIHAGAKMLRNIADTYFKEPGIDSLNKTLLTFASYNAGPTRIGQLRRRAAADGLDPNLWFGNVELEVAKNVGEETVNYVGNIYKYYVAYKLTVAQVKARREHR